MGRKEMIIEEMVRNAGVDPGRILGGENVGPEEKPVAEGTFNFKFYYAAKEAEKEFEAALKAQYGRDAQDKRYTGKDFNAETQAAYEKFRKASDAMHKETLRARGESIEEGADFSTNRHARFREGWEGIVSDFLRMTGFVLVEHLTERGYSTYGVRVRGASAWVKFEGDTSLPYAGGEFVIHINMEHKLLGPTLSVKANRGDDKKSGTLKTPSKLDGKNIFNISPEDLAMSLLFTSGSGGESWGDALGIYD